MSRPGGVEGLTAVVPRAGSRVRALSLPPLAAPEVRLFLTSALILFVELFLIRWIPANVIYVGFFTNFVLMASFLGIGLGFIIGRRGWRAPSPLFPMLFLAVAAAVSTLQLNLGWGGSAEEVFIGPVATGDTVQLDLLALGLLLGLVVVVMVVLALPLGPLFRSMPPLRAYAIDILGSLSGIVTFAVLALLGTGPSVWAIVLAMLVVLLELGRGVTRWSLVVAAALIGTILIGTRGSDVWSPYQRITVYENVDSIVINVNGIPHQGFYKDPSRVRPLYDQVDRWFPGRSFRRVLVVGSGNGTDVAMALRRGAERVDAVEIDPRLLEIGQREHPAHPYADPRVRTYIDDGRAFLRNSSDTYDMIIFGQPDSLVLFSSAANLRLESFLFTREAFESVREHLAPGGMVVLYNYYWQPWLIERMAGLLRETFGHDPIVRLHDLGAPAAVLAAGPLIADLGGPPPGDALDAIDSSSTFAQPTDNWPFLYLRQPGIAPYYLVALVAFLSLSALAVVISGRVSGLSMARFSPHFFVLGTAFLLLETRSLATFGLLFGNTWIVNSMVFFAILLSVLAGILVSARVRFARPAYLYGALFGSIVVAWLLPPASLLVDPPALRYGIASIVAFAPIFLANLCFTQSFRDSRTADMAFASNLLGAMVGGALEYLALLTGYQALLPIVAVLYGLAYLFARRWRFLADRELRLTDTTVVRTAPDLSTA